jgi:hypothetical protein
VTVHALVGGRNHQHHLPGVAKQIDDFLARPDARLARAVPKQGLRVAVMGRIVISSLAKEAPILASVLPDRAKLRPHPCLPMVKD